MTSRKPLDGFCVSRTSRDKVSWEGCHPGWASCASHRVSLSRSPGYIDLGYDALSRRGLVEGLYSVIACIPRTGRRPRGTPRERATGPVRDFPVAMSRRRQRPGPVDVSGVRSRAGHSHPGRGHSRNKHFESEGRLRSTLNLIDRSLGGQVETPGSPIPAKPTPARGQSTAASKALGQVWLDVFRGTASTSAHFRVLRVAPVGSVRRVGGPRKEAGVPGR